jgi:hypothetical protein
MCQEYIKQLEEENAALKSKIENMFEWVVVDAPYRNEYIRDDKTFFIVEIECYVNGMLFALIGKNTSGEGYKGVCKKTEVFDNDIDIVKKSLEHSYMLMFYLKARIP